MGGYLTRVARRLVSTPEAYGWLRTAMLGFQRLTRRPDEPDLWFLARLPERDNDLILDVGANGGQTAVALSFIRPRAEIVSFEPMPALWPELERVRKMLGPRFRYEKCALSAHSGTMTLYVPISGRLPITTRASLSEEDARRQCAELERDIGLPTRLDQIDVEVRVGDREELSPTAIKIDVEGAERSVLDGFSETVKRVRPVFVIERSASFDRCVEFFDRLDYALLTHDGGGAGTLALPGLSDRNWIATPQESLYHFLPDQG